jgi:hypothetical protein
MAGLSTKDQVIRVVIDNSDAMAQDAAFAKQYKANAQARTKADAQAGQDSTKAATDSAREREKSERDYVRAVKSQAKDLERIANDTAREQARAERESARERSATNQAVNRLLADLRREEVRQAQTTAQEQARLVKEGKRAEAQEFQNAHKLAMMQFQWDKDSAKERAAGWDRSSDAIMGGVKSVAAFGAAMIGVSGAGQVLNAVLERFELMRTRALEEAGKMTAEAADLRKLSALEGTLGTPSLTQASQLKLRAQTLQTAGEAERMTTEAKSSALGAISAGRVSPAEFDKFLVTQGKLQTLTHADAGAVGQAAGLMPMITGKASNNAEDLSSLSSRLYEIQRLGGFRDYGQAAEQLGQSAGYVMKGIYSAPELQALQAAFAIGGEGGTASERITQLTRATSANMMRNRKMNLGDDYKENSATSYEYFKRLGITDQTAPIERALKVVADVAAQEDKAKEGGKEFYGTDYLSRQGFNSVQDRESIMKLVGVSRTGLLKQLMEKAEAPLGGDTAIAEGWQNMVRDPMFQERASHLETEAANKGFGTGAGGVKQFENQMLERMYAQTGGAEGNAGYDLKDIKNRWRLDPRNWGNMRGSLSNLEWEAQHRVLEEAGAAGVAVPMTKTIDARSGMESGSETWLGWEKLQEINQQTVAKGGKGALGDNGERLAKAMEKLSDNLEKYVKGPPAKEQEPGKPTSAKPPLTQNPGRP